MHQTPLAAALAGLFTLVAAPVHAQPSGNTPPLLDEIVVTAMRTATTVDETLASVTVITRRDIERAGSLDEVLRVVPDLDVSRNGAYGKSTSLFLRGTNAGHVLVLVDGVRAASATLGTYAWENLRPEQVERIEIVRGPRAALYGSDAVGGVIQIFTRKTRGPFVQAGLGAHGTRQVGAGLAGTTGGDDTWRYSLEAGRFRSDGIPTNRAFSEKHGYDNTHLAAGLEGEILPGARLNLDFSHAQGHSELDANTGDEDFRNQVFSARLAHRVSDTWSQRLVLGHLLDDYTTHSPFLPSNITTRRTSLSWQHDLALVPDGLTSLGLDFWRDRADKDNSGTIHETLDTIAVFAQQQWRALGSDWALGLRGDHHDRYGDKSTGSLAWGRDLTPSTRLIASWGTAFKAPTVNDLFWPPSGDVFFGTTYITLGNPNLRPESSRSLELGLRHRLDVGLSLAANLYRTRVKDLIEWQATRTGPAEYTYRPANVSRAAIDGLELTAAGRLDRWRVNGGVTFIEAENAATGAQLDRRPKRKFTLSLGHPLGSGDFQAELIAAAPRNDLNNTVRLAGYGIVNLAYRQPLGKGLDLQARLENLFDRDYVLASSFSGDYNTLGRSLFLTLRYQPR
jgi:vitamin B12 transporter